MSGCGGRAWASLRFSGLGNGLRVWGFREFLGLGDLRVSGKGVCRGLSESDSARRIHHMSYGLNSLKGGI